MATRIIVNNENGKIIKEEYTPVPISSEQRVNEIKIELNNLDTIINRATEDLYTLTEITPYESIQNVINRKIELRNELKILI